jgi:glutaminyl-peptide cyclotransferase
MNRVTLNNSMNAKPVISLLAGILCLALMTPLIHASFSQADKPSGVPVYGYKVVRVFPHDPNAYTQGLVYYNGFLYEGTGINGSSSLRKVKLETGEVLQKVDLPEQYFGEGITIFKKKILQLTWKAQKGFIYDLDDFHSLGEFSYPGEGWGLTTNDGEVFLSDGTAEIRVLDGNTLKEKRRITVRDGNTPVTQLNELEFVRGEIFANVWQTDRIARISPKTGKVVGWIDLSGILSVVYRRNQDAVLNGIAWDAAGKRLFVTGKLWPSLFQIELVPKK